MDSPSAPLAGSEGMYRYDAFLTGTGVSPGTASGTARTIDSVDQFSTVRAGEILVCRTTDPAWTPLFGLAAAIITETGGMLSHAAIVAREFGIPAVLGIPNALTRIRTGTTLEVDGSRGTVHQRPATPGAGK